MEEDYSPLLSREPTANINSVLDTTHTVVAYVCYAHKLTGVCAAGVQREREREMHADRRTERERDAFRQTDRQTDRQMHADRQPDRQTEIQRERLFSEMFVALIEIIITLE